MSFLMKLETEWPLIISKRSPEMLLLKLRKFRLSELSKGKVLRKGRKVRFHPGAQITILICQCGQ
jgi:hypothetical protein